MSTVLKFPRPSYPSTPRSAPQEVRVADLDDGYTRTANEIQKAKCKLRMAGRELNVLDAVIYSTYGWNKKQDRLTNTYLAELCDMDPSDVNKALLVLASRHIITLEKRGHMKIVGVNKVVSEWEYARKKTQKALGDSAENPGEITQIHGCFDLSNQSKTPNTQDSLTQDNKKDLKNSSSQLAGATLDKVSDPLLIVDAVLAEPKARIISGATVQTPSGKAWGTAEDLTAAQWIFKRVQVIAPTALEPNWVQWSNVIRLMREIDRRSHHEICELYDWASRDPFWCTNVLSPQKLRQQWTQLTVKRQAPSHTKRPMSNIAQAQQQAQAMREAGVTYDRNTPL